MQDHKKPICFVSIPFGRKNSSKGTEYDFDSIYTEGIKPAVEQAGCEVLRADDDNNGVIIHKTIYERILTADVVIADLTTANANVVYELGIRHAARKGTTITIMADEEYIFFDTLYLRMIPYECSNARLTMESAERFKSTLTERIRQNLMDDGAIDSPLFMLFKHFPGINISSSTESAEIFLSYAREDQEKVLQIYMQLKNHNFQPWIDQKDIIPGERWELVIEEALRRADFILVFISKLSTNKRGYLRREIRNALEKSYEMLETDIFLVPVRLDDCVVPQELKNFQWIDIYEDNGFNRLIEALRTGLARRRNA